MKIILHICLADGEPNCTASVPLPGGLIAQYWGVVEPVVQIDGAPASNAAASPGGRIWRRELAQPGITYECYSLEQAAAVLRRELEGDAYLM